MESGLKVRVRRLDRSPWDVPRKALVRAHDYTDPSHGCNPEDRPLPQHLKFGVINLDKPRGPTSHEVVSWVERILEVGKAGHGGTLDPKVSGVLPIALQGATKLTRTLLLAEKEYVFVMHLHGEVSDRDLRKVLKEFEGEIYQLPPVRAAVKRVLRKRRIYYLDLLERRERDVLLRIACQAGTYVRKLCFDIGRALGCGAHMMELRRTRTGPFKEESESLVTLHDLADAFAFWKEDGIEGPIRRAVMPMERAVYHLPKIVVRDSAVDALCRGASLAAPGVLSVETGVSRGDMVAEMTQKGELVALGRSSMTSNEIYEAEHGIVAEPDRVVMEPGTYPRKWK